MLVRPGVSAGSLRFGQVDWADPKPTARFVAREELEGCQQAWIATPQAASYDDPARFELRCIAPGLSLSAYDIIPQVSTSQTIRRETFGLPSRSSRSPI